MKKLSILLIILLLLTGCGSKTYSGKIEVIEGAKDSEFGITTESALLYREVEMVQWINDEQGVRLVLANYPIESFEYDGKEYINPSFPIESACFVGKSTISGVELSEDVLKAIMFSDIGAKTSVVEELPISFRSDVDLVQYGSSYATGHNDWTLGDVKITFSYLDDDSSFTVKGSVKDNVLSLTSVSK